MAKLMVAIPEIDPPGEQPALAPMNPVQNLLPRVATVKSGVQKIHDRMLKAQRDAAAYAKDIERLAILEVEIREQRSITKARAAEYARQMRELAKREKAFATQMLRAKRKAVGCAKQIDAFVKTARKESFKSTRRTGSGVGNVSRKQRGDGAEPIASLPKVASLVTDV